MFDDRMLVTFQEYENSAASTDLSAYHSLPLEVYYSLKLAGEAGEVAEKIAKVYRDDKGVYTDEKRVELVKELGDVLWYLARLAAFLGANLGIVAYQNVKKIMSRKARGVLGGSGDNR